MGIGKNGYYTTHDILKCDATYNLVISGRGVGKSYAVVTGILKKAWDTHACVMGYLRRRREDIQSSDVEADFADKKIAEITEGEYDTVSVWRRQIYFARTGEDGKTIRHPKPFARIFSLNQQEKVKSRQFPSITDVLYEEFITDGVYLRDEPRLLQQLVSTIFRDRPGRIWMLGNTISRVNPYAIDWHLDHLSAMHPGDIDVYTIDGVRVAVEYSKSRGITSGMFFGSTGKSIERGTWETHQHLTLDMLDDDTSLDVCAEIGIKAAGMQFYVTLCVTDKGDLWASVTHTLSIPPDTIILSDTPTTDPYTVTTSGDLKPLQILRRLYRTHKVLYSDQLTGEDFVNAMKNSCLL